MVILTYIGKTFLKTIFRKKVIFVKFGDDDKSRQKRVTQKIIAFNIKM